MLKDEDSKLRVQCLLKEYDECAECFRHTYTTIWQSGILFATFSVAVFGFFFSKRIKHVFTVSSLRIFIKHNNMVANDL